MKRRDFLKAGVVLPIVVPFIGSQLAASEVKEPEPEIDDSEDWFHGFTWREGVSSKCELPREAQLGDLHFIEPSNEVMFYDGKKWMKYATADWS